MDFSELELIINVKTIAEDFFEKDESFFLKNESQMFIFQCLLFDDIFSSVAFLQFILINKKISQKAELLD